MTDAVTGSASKFKESFKCLARFLDRWVPKIKDRCESDSQRRAAWYVWARWSLSFRTLDRICDANFLPDIYVIARSCFECEASLKAIMAEPELAQEYLEFSHKARAYYGCLLERLGDTDGLAKLEPDLKKVLGSEWRKKKSMQWARTSKVIETYCETETRKLYAFTSHFVHGSALVAQYLERTLPTDNRLDIAIAVTYGSYVLSTSDFLDFIWGQIVTPDSEGCKKEWEQVMASWV